MTKINSKSYTHIPLFGVIIISILIFCATFIFYKVSRKESKVFVDLTYTSPDWSQTPMPPEFTETEALKTNDCAYDSGGRAVACITNVRTAAWTGKSRVFQITVSLTTYYDPRTKTYVFQSSPMLIGNTLNLEFPHVSFQGKITNVYKNQNDQYRNYEQKKALITILLRSIEPSYAQALKNFDAKDSNGKQIAKTISIEITPAEVEVNTDAGLIYKGYSPIFVDALITLEADSIICMSGTCYFNDTVNLKIGSKDLYVQSDSTFISEGIITDIKYQ